MKKDGGDAIRISRSDLVVSTSFEVFRVLREPARRVVCYFHADDAILSDVVFARGRGDAGFIFFVENYRKSNVPNGTENVGKTLWKSQNPYHFRRAQRTRCTERWQKREERQLQYVAVSACSVRSNDYSIAIKKNPARGCWNRSKLLRIFSTLRGKTTNHICIYIYMFWGCRLAVG